MKKASKIVLTIGAICNLALTVGCVIAGLVVCIVAAVNQSCPAGFIELVSDIVDSFDASLDLDALLWISIGVYCLTVLTISFFAFVFFLVSTILAFNGAKAKKNGILIANIIFGFLGQNLIVITGAVFGIIGLKLEEKKAEQPQEQEVKEVEQK